MRITTRTIQFISDEHAGPAQEQLALTAAWLKNHLPEVSVAAAKYGTDFAAIILRSPSPEVVALAEAAIACIGLPRAPRMKFSPYDK